MNDSMETRAENDPFFIGWFPMPRPLVKFLLPIAIGLLIGSAGLAAWIAFGQRSPGPGVWDDGKTTTLQGVVVAEPYAMIRIPSPESPSGMETILLVEEGKFGAKQRIQSWDGQVVQVTGTILERDGRRMMELVSTDDAIQPGSLAPEWSERLRSYRPLGGGSVALKGEIVDSKCFLGAMKPGLGKTHKGCAILCLKGGVPPLFVTRNPSGGLLYHLLVNRDGTPLPEQDFACVGESVTVRGDLETWGDLMVLKVSRIDPLER